MTQLLPGGHVWAIVKRLEASDALRPLQPGDAFLSRKVAWRILGIPRAEKERTHVVAFRDITHALAVCEQAGSGLALWPDKPGTPVSLRSVDLKATTLAERLVINGMALDVVEGLTETGEARIASFFADELPAALYAANLNNLLAMPWQGK